MLANIVRTRVAGTRAFSTNAALVERERKYVTQNYAPYPVVFNKGLGVHMWDVEGKKYLDFMSGYGSVNQGHCHPEVIKVAVDQMHKLTQTSRAFHNENLGAFGEYICNLTGYDKFMPANGGCEACEGAIKYARRWGYYVKGVEADKASVIMANNNFWGRSLAASGSSNDPYRYKDFGPYDGGFPLVDYDSLESIEAQLVANQNTVAVYLEPIQGEGGIIMPSDGYLAGVKALCKKYNCLLIADEV